MGQFQDTIYHEHPVVIRDVTASQFAAQANGAPKHPGIRYRVDGQTEYQWNGAQWVAMVSAAQSLTGGSVFFAGGKKIQSAEINSYYHFHGFAGDQFSGDSKFYDKAAGNHGSFGANLSLAQAWATAGYVSTVEPVAGAVDSVIRIPSLNFDYSGGEKLIVWGLGAITPEGADASLMGDCPFAQANTGGVRVRAKANGKMDVVLFGAGSVGRYSGQSTAVPFDGALHSYAFALDGTTKKYGIWVDEAYEPVFGPDYSVFSAGQDADTRNPGTWNIGAASPAPGGTEGMATRHRALVILRMPASAEMPSVATLTSLFKQLRANPGRLIAEGAI